MSQPGPWFHGTATEYEAGALVKPEYELGARRGQGRVYATTKPEVARDYGAHKAWALAAGYGVEAQPRAYEVEPTGRMEPDPTVAEEFAAWRTRAPMRVVRELTAEAEAEAG